jgi:phage head maturation protease
MTDRATMIGRDAAVRSNSFNEADNTVEIVFTTGATVQRFSYAEGIYDEELIVEPGSVRLERLNAGAPFLNTHDDTKLRSVIGSVVPGSARIEKGRGVCTVLLSRREDVRGIVQDIRDGVIRHISVGYRYHKIEKTGGQDGDPVHWRVVDWEPLEISAVPIPADPGAQFRSDPPRTPAPPALAIATRNSSPSISAPRNTMPIDNPTRRAEAITAALLHRADPETFALTDQAREYRGLTMSEIASDLLRAAGVAVRGLSRSEIVDLALSRATRDGGLMSTADFPAILANVGNKTLRAAYEAAPQTWRPFVRETTLSDFRESSRIQLGEAPQLERVNEHGEYKRGRLSEGRESYALLTYGKVVGLTRQSIINDDLGAFTRLARGFGIQAANLESDLVWAQIIGNPVMGDGNTLFHASHGNVGTADGITAESIGEAFKLMRLQRGLDGKTFLNLMPSYLIVPVNVLPTAMKFLTASTPAMVATQQANVVPAYLQTLTPISEPRLDSGFTDPATGTAIAGNSFNWFMAGDPAQNDTVEIAYLEGERGLQTTTRAGFDIDGVEVKARLDVGAKVIDWRSFFKNPATWL